MNDFNVNDPEYAAFGPWIIPIKKAEQLPPRFVDAVDMTIDYDYIFKVPRSVDRRDVRPGMDMYDAVVGLKDTTLSVYERNDTQITGYTVNIDEICSIVVHQNLLSGHLYLYSAHKMFTIPFNTVSLGEINVLVKLIRDRYTLGKKTFQMNHLPEESIHALDHYYKNEWRGLKSEEADLSLLAMQPITKLSYKSDHIVKKFLNRLSRSHIKSSLYMTNGRELILSKNGEDFARFRKADYSISKTYIPFNNIEKISTDTFDTLEEVNQLTFTVGENNFSFLFHESNPYLKHIYENMQQICV